MSEPAMKVLIADDEPMARRRLRSFPLQKHGYEIVAEAENGEQALTMIRQHAPDIVVADIGMPVMNGLELLKRVGELPAAPKVILLTCYEDFDKIQTALRYGAHDYITKLLLAEGEFIACLNKAADNIRQERRHLQKAVRQLLLDVLLRSGAEAEASLAQLAGLSFPSRRHAVGLIRCAPEKTNDMFRAVPAFETADQERMSVVLAVEPGLWAVLFVSSRPGGDAEFLVWATGVLRQGYEACSSLGVSTVQALSDIRGELIRMPSSLAESRLLLDRAFYMPPGGPVTIRTPFQTKPFPPDRFDAHLQACRRAAEGADAAAAADVLLSWLDDAERAYRPSPAELKLMGAALAGCWNDLRPGGAVPMDGAESIGRRLQERIEASQHLSELREAVEEAADLLREERQHARGVRAEIREALRLVRDHYREDIDLPAAARHVNLSPSWFGTLFRNEMGRSFFDYLQDYRLEQAKLMLMHTDLKVYEIAAQAGIPNSRYFSRLFAEKFNASPQDYRSGLRGAGGSPGRPGAAGKPGHRRPKESGETR